MIIYVYDMNKYELVDDFSPCRLPRTSYEYQMGLTKPVRL